MLSLIYQGLKNKMGGIYALVGGYLCTSWGVSVHFANFDFFYKPHFYAPLKSNNIIVFFSNKINKINTNAQGGF